jgi:p-aminobenzoyl-glutamate transporter AbgT
MDTTHAEQEGDGFLKRMLDLVEKAGNKVQHPVMIFLFLIVVVHMLSLPFYAGPAIS